MKIGIAIKATEIERSGVAIACASRVKYGRKNEFLLLKCKQNFVPVYT